MKSNLKIEIVTSVAVFVALLFVAFSLNNADTGDAGDSLVHYLFSAHAFQYPEHFFNHWAKPVFVLLSSVFAQFGFKGMFVFNILCAVLSALFAFYTARNLKIKYPILVFVFIFASPLYFKLIFSGLTEYLFGLFLILAIFLYQKKKYIPSIILVSFLPLVRSEGLLILGVFTVYLILNKGYKKLPYLLIGQAIYTLAGAIFHKDIIWVFSEIPYAHLGSPYGSGKLTDFIYKLYFVVERPITVLLVIGVLSLLFAFLKAENRTVKSISVFLILGSFVTFFVAHSVFWWLGIFNSMGLSRVLISVVPVIAVISLIGLQVITDRLSNKLVKSVVTASYMVLIIVYPFRERPWAVVYNENLFLVEENRFIEEELVPYIKSNFPDYLDNSVYYSHPYISVALNVDFFDQIQYKRIRKVLNNDSTSKAIVIWDEWASGEGENISLEQLNDVNGLDSVQLFERQVNHRTIQLVVYKR